MSSSGALGPRRTESSSSASEHPRVLSLFFVNVLSIFSSPKQRREEVPVSLCAGGIQGGARAPGAPRDAMYSPAPHGLPASAPRPDPHPAHSLSCRWEGGQRATPCAPLPKANQTTGGAMPGVGDAGGGAGEGGAGGGGGRGFHAGPSRDRHGTVTRDASRGTPVTRCTFNPSSLLSLHYLPSLPLRGRLCPSPSSLLSLSARLSLLSRPDCSLSRFSLSAGASLSERFGASEKLDWMGTERMERFYRSVQSIGPFNPFDPSVSFSKTTDLAPSGESGFGSEMNGPGGGRVTESGALYRCHKHQCAP